MKTLITALLLAGMLSACAFHAPQAPQPADSPRLPVNATAPYMQGG
ncbi:conjugal transfer protein [Allopusillimonas ginsengisoli]|nr:conjugal transfer protein [Allopusillimonas ginsengisoli]